MWRPLHIENRNGLGHGAMGRTRDPAMDKDEHGLGVSRTTQGGPAATATGTR